jgi:hypothetical protein
MASRPGRSPRRRFWRGYRVGSLDRLWLTARRVAQRGAGEGVPAVRSAAAKHDDHRTAALPRSSSSLSTSAVRGRPCPGSSKKPRIDLDLSKHSAGLLSPPAAIDRWDRAPRLRARQNVSQPGQDSRWR